MSTGITVTIVAGRNLPSADSNGLSDPYCIVSVSGRKNTKRQTSVRKKTLSPEWRETFRLPIVDPQGDTLKVQVWDKDRVTSDDYLGEVVLWIKTINSPCQMWFPLSHKDGKYTCGELFLDIRLGESSGAAGQPLATGGYPGAHRMGNMQHGGNHPVQQPYVGVVVLGIIVFFYFFF
jgi:hypothetical protein